MRILTPDRYDEYESFVKKHKNGSFTQSIRWPKVKPNWESAVVVSEDSAGNITGSMLVLILPNAKKDGYALMYAPRGPLCDYYDPEAIADLLDGAKQLGREWNANIFKVDPYVLASDQKAIDAFTSVGFKFTPDAKFHQTIQTRENYMLLGLDGKTEDELFMHFDRKTRYYIRFAERRGVKCEICDSSRIDDFYEVYAKTGERQSFSIRPKSYLKNFLDVYGDDIRLYMCYYDGVPVSGAITVTYAGKTAHIYGGSSNDYREFHPNDLMQWNMMKWAIQSGSSLYDFQGVCTDPAESEELYGVYLFKCKFNGEVVKFAGEFIWDEF